MGISHEIDITDDVTNVSVEVSHDTVFAIVMLLTMMSQLFQCEVLKTFSHFVALHSMIEQQSMIANPMPARTKPIISSSVIALPPDRKSVV